LHLPSQMHDWIADRICCSRDAQKFRYSEWPAEQSLEDRTPRVLEHQRQVVAVAGKFHWVHRPGGIQVGLERVFMFEPRETTERIVLCGGQQYWRQSLAGTPIQRQVAAAQLRKCVTRKIPHESFSQRRDVIKPKSRRPIRRMALRLYES